MVESSRKSEEDDTELGLFRQTTAPNVWSCHKDKTLVQQSDVHVALEEKNFKYSSFLFALTSTSWPRWCVSGAAAQCKSF